MTDPVVPENPRRTELIATGGQDTFQFDFPGVAQASDLRVYQDGDLTTDFVLTAATKTIVLDVPAEDGDSIVIEGLKKIERKNEYPRSGNLQTRTLNPEINSIFEMIQELRRDVDRAITFNKSAITTNNALPVFPEPGRALITGANGIEIADQNIGDFDEAIAAAAQHADEAAQAAAATELDAAIAEAAKSGAESARDAAQAAAAGMKWRQPVRVATTGNITLSGTQTIDGVALIAGDRVLVKNQSAAAQNGVYVVAAGAWSRATDADSWSELVSQVVIAEEGDANAAAGADLGYICTVNAGGTLGATAVTWANFNPPGLALASQVEAETGAENTKYMSALRVYQAIQALTKGSILQIQQTIDNTTSSISATTSTQAFGPSVSITPQRASSKIRLSWHFVYQAGTTDRVVYSTLLQAGSPITALVGASPGSRQAISGGESAAVSKPCVYAGSVILDAGSTSARTYGMGISVNAADTVYLNRSAADTNAASFWRAASWITAEEISQ